MRRDTETADLFPPTRSGLAQQLGHAPHNHAARGTAGAATRAAADAVMPGMGTRCAAVLEALGAFGGVGATADEVADALGLIATQVRPRITQLADIGLIEQTGEFGTTALGRSSAKWRSKTF